VDEEAIPILRVADAAAAVAWYGRLGFTKEWEHRFEPGLPAFVSVARGRVRLFPSEPAAMPAQAPWSTCGCVTST
jgi:catechol 2,3-dioxygenase-like lactoylglutathione lyase family enzyme